jgi:hypothetical protein
MCFFNWSRDWLRTTITFDLPSNKFSSLTDHLPLLRRTWSHTRTHYRACESKCAEGGSNAAATSTPSLRTCSPSTNPSSHQRSTSRSRVSS